MISYRNTVGKMTYYRKRGNKLRFFLLFWKSYRKKVLIMPTALNRQYPSTVLAKDSQTALQATASAPAGVNSQRYYITGVDASYSAAQAGLLQLKDGNNVIWEGYVQNAMNQNFDAPIEGSAVTIFSAVLAAGAAAVIGKVNLRGYLY